MSSHVAEKQQSDPSPQQSDGPHPNRGAHLRAALGFRNISAFYILAALLIMFTFWIPEVFLELKRPRFAPCSTVKPSCPWPPSDSSSHFPPMCSATSPSATRSGWQASSSAAFLVEADFPVLLAVLTALEQRLDRRSRLRLLVVSEDQLVHRHPGATRHRCQHHVDQRRAPVLDLPENSQPSRTGTVGPSRTQSS